MEGETIMALAQNTIKEMIDIYKRAKGEYEKLSKELSISEKEIQVILHRIEFEELNSVICFSTVMKLKHLRIARRRIKTELAPLQTFIDMIDIQQLKRIQERINIHVNKQESKCKPNEISDRLIEAVIN